MTPTRDIINEWADECYPDEEILLFDGFDEAFIGFGCQQYKGPFAIYDRERCIEILAGEFAKDGDGDDEAADPYADAVEWFSFNTERSWVGEGTPIIVSTLENYRRLYED
jgi:hypothetical protein